MQPPDHQQLYHLLHTAVDVKTVKQRDSHTLQQASVYCGITHSRAKNFSKRCQLNVFVDVEKTELQYFWRLFNVHYWCWFIDTGFKIKVSINVMLNFFLTSATDISRTFCGMKTLHSAMKWGSPVWILTHLPGWYSHPWKEPNLCWMLISAELTQRYSLPDTLVSHALQPKTKHHNNKLTEKVGGLENYRRLKTDYLQFFKVLDTLKTFWQEFGQKLASTWPTKWNRQGSICYSWREIKCYIKNYPPARQDARVSVHIYHKLIEWCPELTLESWNTAEVPLSPSLSGYCNQHLAHASVKTLAELTE